MTTILIVVALLLASAGAVFLSKATLGVGLICLACLFGILARIAQAAWGGDELGKRIAAVVAGATREAEASVEVPEAQEGGRSAVIRSRAARLRAAPNARGTVLARLEAGTPVEVFSKREGYFGVRVPSLGQKGWVLEACLELGPPNQPLQQTAPQDPTPSGAE